MGVRPPRAPIRQDWQNEAKFRGRNKEACVADAYGPQGLLAVGQPGTNVWGLSGARSFPAFGTAGPLSL
jgi:hypothetical protein